MQLAGNQHLKSSKPDKIHLIASISRPSLLSCYRVLRSRIFAGGQISSGALRFKGFAIPIHHVDIVSRGGHPERHDSTLDGSNTLITVNDARRSGTFRGEFGRTVVWGRRRGVFLTNGQAANVYTGWDPEFSLLYYTRSRESNKSAGSFKRERHLDWETLAYLIQQRRFVTSG